jgi:hypothetical protein
MPRKEPRWDRSRDAQRDQVREDDAQGALVDGPVLRKLQPSAK